MSPPAPTRAIERRSVASLSLNTPRRDVQELWFNLARRQWTSLVLVPADEGESAAAIATALADVGRRLREGPVTFMILADPIDYVSAGRILAAEASSFKSKSESNIAQAGKVIASIQPVIAEPLGLAVTAVTDVVVICVHVGRTRTAAVRRTIELIGRERIAGALLVT
jgi:hypothetical protein